MNDVTIQQLSLWLAQWNYNNCEIFAVLVKIQLYSLTNNVIILIEFVYQHAILTIANVSVGL